MTLSIGFVLALAAPEDLELATFWVTATAAVGTVAIALLNVMLLARQHKLERNRDQTAQRLRRQEVAEEATEMMMRLAVARVKEEVPPPEERERELAATIRTVYRISEGDAENVMLAALSLTESVPVREAVARSASAGVDLMRWADNPKAFFKSPPYWLQAW